MTEAEERTTDPPPQNGKDGPRRHPERGCRPPALGEISVDQRAITFPAGNEARSIEAGQPTEAHHPVEEERDQQPGLDRPGRRHRSQAPVTCHEEDHEQHPYQE